MAQGCPSYEPFVFHQTSKHGRSAVLKEFKRLPQQARAALQLVMVKFSEGRARVGRDFKRLRDGICEIRVRLGSNPYRVLFALDGRQPVALTAFHKKDQETSNSDIDLALQRWRSWPGLAALQ